VGQWAAVKSHLEIAQEATLRPIEEVAQSAGLLPEEVEPYGRYRGKVALEVLDRLKDRPDGKLIITTAITPTKAGEGKTTTSISLTQGMGKIKAVRKYENPIEFLETHKLWMDTNRKPTISDADDRATFNRLHPIPFTVCIPKDQIDRSLPEKLLAEGEGILVWLVEGARLWAENGLNTPPEVLSAKGEWRAEMDQLGQFITDSCVEGESLEFPASTLYAAYKDWAEKGGEKALTQTAFGRKLRERGFEKRETSRGNVYKGLARKAADADGG
jgi:putative DNA primase/helicase